MTRSGGARARNVSPELVNSYLGNLKKVEIFVMANDLLSLLRG